MNWTQFAALQPRLAAATSLGEQEPVTDILVPG